MRITSKKIFSTLIVFHFLLSYSGFAIPSCDCCNEDHAKVDKESGCCGHEMHRSQAQSNCHNEKEESSLRQKHCNCSGDCECSFLCNMPDYNNAVATSMQHIPNNLLNQIAQQPISFVIEHFTSFFISNKPDKSRLNPLKLPRYIPLRI